MIPYWMLDAIALEICMKQKRGKNMKEKITPYLEIRDKLDTFTIINCEPHNLFWRLIGHTAVVYKCRETGQLMVLESTTLNKFTGKSGVQLTPMGLWVNNYPGRLYVRIPEFSFNPSNPRIRANKGLYNATLDMAESFIKKYLESSYPDLKTWSGKMKLILSALDFKILGKDIFTYKGDDKGIFCTMLVVMFYKYCQLMRTLSYRREVRQTADKFASEFEPDDTRNDAIFEMYLKNCVLGKEIRIK